MVLGAIHNGRRLGICRIRGAFMMKRILSFLLLTFSLPAFANSWELVFFGEQATSGQFVSSPVAHCTSISSMVASGVSNGSTYHTVTFEGFIDSSGNTTTDPAKYFGAQCKFYHPWYLGAWSASYRLKTTCSLPSVLDPVTGECVAPEEPEDPCADKAGTDTPFSKAGTAPDGFAFVSSNGMGGTQRQGCKGGCATEIVDNRCKWGVGGAYYCRGTATYTGQQCATTGTGDQIDEDTNDSTEPETVKEETPCIYSAVGGKQVCESNKSEEKEGQSCGTVNGVQTCVDKAPTKNEVDVKTEITTETNPDGSTTTTKTDTATVTNCSGINSCTTSTTTNTTTTEKDEAGNVTSVSGMCVGEHCPDKKTDPDGDGDGLGDCVYGDCSDDEFGGPENEDVPGFGESAQAFMGKVAASPLVSSITGIGFPEGGSCSMSSASTPLGTISGSVVCDNTHWLDPLYYVFLAMHALGAVRILMSA